MLMMLIAALFDYQKNDTFNPGKALAGFIVLTIIMLLFRRKRGKRGLVTTTIP
jgi:hypothetical protein